MRSSSIHCLFGTTALTLLSFDQASFADDALTAGSKSIVREFYTTVLINRHVDAAPRFLRPDYSWRCASRVLSQRGASRKHLDWSIRISGGGLPDRNRGNSGARINAHTRRPDQTIQQTVPILVPSHHSFIRSFLIRAVAHLEFR